MAIRLSTQSVSADTPKSDNMSETSSWVQAKSKCDPTDPDELLPENENRKKFVKSCNKFRVGIDVIETFTLMYSYNVEIIPS